MKGLQKANLRYAFSYTIRAYNNVVLKYVKTSIGQHLTSSRCQNTYQSFKFWLWNYAVDTSRVKFDPSVACYLCDTATLMPSVPELENQSVDYKDDFHLRRKISFFKVTVSCSRSSQAGKVRWTLWNSPKVLRYKADATIVGQSMISRLHHIFAVLHCTTYQKSYEKYNGRQVSLPLFSENAAI